MNGFPAWSFAGTSWISVAARYRTTPTWLVPGEADFHYLIEEYYRLFGPENVLVLPLELLTRRGPKAFVNPIYEFLDLPFPVTYPSGEARNVRDYRRYVFKSRLRFLNALAAPTPANGNVGLGATAVLSTLTSIGAGLLTEKVAMRAVEQDLSIIRDYFSRIAGDTNRKLQNYVTADLAELGYTL